MLPLSTFDLRVTPSRRRAVLIYTAGGWASNVILILQGFLLIPLYIRYLGTDLYGFWLASGGVLAWISMVDVGSAAITRQRCGQAYGKGDLQRMVNYFWHGAVVLALVILLFLLLLLSLTPLIPAFIRATDAYHSIIYQCLLLAGAGLALTLFEQFLREFSSAAQRNALPALASFLGLLLGLVTIVLGLVVFEWGLYSLAIGALVRPAVPALCNLILALALLHSSGYKKQWSWSVFRDYMVTTPAVLAAKASGVFSNQLPVILLTRWFGPEITVVYNVSIALLGALKHFMSHALNSFHGSIAHYFGDTSIDEERKEQLFRKTSRLFVAATIGLFSFYALINQGFVSLWIGSGMYAGSLFTFMAALAVTMQLRNVFYTSLIGSRGAIRTSGYASSLERMFTAVLLIVFVQAWDIHGVFPAIIVATLCGQIPYHYLLKRLEPAASKGLVTLQWFWLPVAMVFLITTTLSQYLVVNAWFTFSAIIAVILLIYSSLAWAVIPDLRQIMSNIYPFNKS